MAAQQEKILSRRQFLGIVAAGAGTLAVDALLRPHDVFTQDSSASPQPLASESSQPLPSEQPITTTESPIYLTDRMKERASRAFEEGYQEIKTRYLFDAGEGALRLQYSQNPNNPEAAIEYNTLGELIALYAGDPETAEALMKFDDRYKQPNGLTPWKIKRIGQPADFGTIVSDTMIRLAAARLMSKNSERQAEGREALQSIKDNKMIDPKTHLFRAFDWDDQLNLANPAYPNPLYVESFSEIDPYYAEVADATRRWMGVIDSQIESGEIAFFPSWVDLKGNVTDNEGEPAKITYYAPYVALNQALGALFCEDPEARADATKQLAIVNRFFYERIAKTDSKGNADYNSDRLLDGYKLNGRVDRSEDRYTDTAFTTAAALASITSDDPEYREYMFNVLINLPHPAYEPFNDYMRTFALLALSGKMGKEPMEKAVPELVLRPGQVIEHGDRSKPEIFFTVDDGWDKKEVIKYLDIARDLGIKLTFFAVGDNVEAFPEVWKRAYKEGHSIQNHSMTHPEAIHKMSKAEISAEITGQLEAVRKAIEVSDYTQHSFRPPYGVGAPPWDQLSAKLQNVCRELDLAIVTFTSVSEAWNGDSPREVQRKLGRDINNGSILTLHDEPSDIKAFPKLVRKATKAGLTPRKIDALFT